MQNLPQEEWQKAYDAMYQSLERLGRAIRRSKIQHQAPIDLVGYAEMATSIIAEQSDLIQRLRGSLE